MKSKLKALLGIGLTLVLLTSLMVGLAVPAGAAPAKLKFSTLTLPKVDKAGDYWAYPGSDVGAIAIAADGETLFAAVEKSGWDVMKSSDGGYSWKMLDDFRTVAEAAEAESPIVVDVAVSPDYEEDLTVIVATEHFLYQSVDGGKRFVRMTTEWSDAEDITDLDIALDGRGRLAIMVGTTGVFSTTTVTLEQSGEGTAEWSHDYAHLGSYSVFLSDGGQGWTSDDSYGAGVVEVAGVNTLLADITDLSFWFNRDTPDANFEYFIPALSLCIDTTGDGTADYEACVNSDVQPAGPEFLENEWDEWTVGEWDNWHDSLGNWNKTLAQIITIVDEPEAVVLSVKVLVGCWRGHPGADTFTANTAYVDEITITTDGDPTTYNLDAGGDVYVLSTATGMSWQPQGIGVYNVLACAFSPFFADDEGIAAVVTDSTSTEVRFSFAYVGSENPEDGWGADIGDATVKDAKGLAFPSNHASIAFPDDFDPWGIGNNVCFAGIYAGEAYDPDAMKGDVYRVVLGSSSSATDLDIRGVITTLLPTATNIWSIDVCGDAEDANIIVGTDYCDLGTTGYYFLAYRSDDGGETWIPSGATKGPTGGDAIRILDTTLVAALYAQTQVLMSPDFLTDEIAYAATSGLDTSALSRTKDSGATWDQIGLIDYGHETNGYVIEDLDAAGYNADGTLHMTTSVTDANGAVWKRTDGKNWERIWSYANPGTTNDISELIINGDETMFAVDYTAEKMWRSSNMGATWPKSINTKPNLKCVTIVSPTTIYTGHTDGDLYWSTKSGTAWQKPEDNPNTNTIGLIQVKGDNVLVSTAVGKVYFSSDGGETLERVGVTDPGTEGAAIATYDLGFAENNIIYCVISFGPGTPGDAIYRTELDIDDPSSSEWVSIDDIAGSDLQESVVYLGPAATLPPNGVLYAFDGAAVNDPTVTPLILTGGLWRCTNPTADVDSPVPPYFERENKGLDEDDVIAFLDADVFPTTIFCGNLADVPYYQQVVMFTDTLDSGVALADPGDGAAGVGLIPAGEVAASLKLAWKGMAGATSYQYQVAIDSDFMSVVASGFTSSLVTPTLKLSPNKTYYWRVRVANEVVPEKEPKYLIGAPLISPWSETWKFKTAIGATMARPALEAPDAGEVDVLLSPTFEWSGIAWAEKYEFELATDPGTTAGGYFASTLVSLTGANALVSTAWKCDIDLDYNTRYYWHAKAFGVDTETPWSDVGTFVTMAKPVPPVEPTAPVVIPPVEEITPAWIWAIIGIGAALVIAVIVLVVTTRRVP